MINLHKIDWIKIGLLILSLVLLFFFFRQCGSIEKYELAIKERQNAIKKSEQIVQIKNAEIKQIKAEKTDLRKAIENQKSKTYLLKQKLSKIDKSRKVITKIIKVPTVCEEATKDLLAQNNTLKEVVASQDSIITQQDSLDALSEREIIKLNDIIDEKTYQKQSEDKTIEEQVEIAKKEKRKKTFWIVVSEVLAILFIVK
jgi:hypothetical protein